jgi:uncharacterized DUF497 family protein
MSPTFEFDPQKDAANQAKHGLSLARIRDAVWPPDLAARDARRDYGEVRWYAFLRLDERVHVAIFTYRGDVVRVISLRKANPREVELYNEQLS